MSAGCKPGYGPSLPKDTRGRRPNLGKGKSKRTRRAVSPRTPAQLRSNSAVPMSGQPFEANPTDILGGILINDTRAMRAQYDAMDTNTNRAHGGTSTFYRPKEGFGY